MWKMSDWRDTCTEFKCVSHAWNHNVAISFLLFSSCKKCKSVSDFIQSFIQQKNLFLLAVKQHSSNFLDFYPLPYIEISLHVSICYVPHHTEKLSDAWSLIKYHTAAKNSWLFGILVTSYEAIYFR